MQPGRAGALALLVLVTGCASLPGRRAGPPPLATPPPAAAERPAPAPARTETPLLPAELFLHPPEVTTVALSPAGDRVAFARDPEAGGGLWVVAAGEPLERAWRVTGAGDPVARTVRWSAHGRCLLVVRPGAGGPDHLFAVEPAPVAGRRLCRATVARAAAATAPPEAGAIDLTPDAAGDVELVAVPAAVPGEVLVAMARDAGGGAAAPPRRDLYRLELASGERTLAAADTLGVASWWVDRAGDPRLAVRRPAAGGDELWAVTAGRPSRRLLACGPEETCRPLAFHPDGRRLYLATDAGAGVERVGLALLDLAGGHVEAVESDPRGEVDLGGAVFGPAGRLLATWYAGDEIRLQARDAAFRSELEALRDRLPARGLRFLATAAGGDRWVVEASGPREPGVLVLWDRPSGEVRTLHRAFGELPRWVLATVEPVRLTARDGLTLHAALTRPRGSTATGLPAVVLVRADPWSRDRPGFDPQAQWLANRGYAVLQVDPRGSSGYGKGFAAAGDGRWGGAVLDDVADGVSWLAEEGTADPDRVAIAGASWGGYAALAAVAFTPELYAAAVSIDGPVDLLAHLGAVADPRRRELLRRRVGDPDDPRDRRRLSAQSPLAAAAAVRAPLLVVRRGGEPAEERAAALALVARLRERGREAALLVVPGAAGGDVPSADRRALAAAVEEFLAAHLGGRAAEAPAAVRRRLDALRATPSAGTETSTGPSAAPASGDTPR